VRFHPGVDKLYTLLRRERPLGVGRPVSPIGISFCITAFERSIGLAEESPYLSAVMFRGINQRERCFGVHQRSAGDRSSAERR
jgi:hypothetical protein